MGLEGEVKLKDSPMSQASDCLASPPETLALLVIKCVNFFVPQFSHLENGADNSIYFMGMS